MDTVNSHLQKPVRFENLSYQLEDGTTHTAKAVVIPAIIKSVSNKTRPMNNKKKTLFRIATVEAFNPTTKAVESKQVQLINNLYEATEESFAVGSEVEVSMQYDTEAKKTYAKVQLGAVDTFDFAQYASATAEEVVETV